MKINLEEFEVIEPKRKKQNRQVISVFEDGSFSVNEELVKALKTNKFEIHLHKKDCNMLLLNPNGKIITDMGKNNRIKNYAILERLKRQKVKFPIYYVGEWNEENQCWIGELSVTNPNKAGGKIKK